MLYLPDLVNSAPVFVLCEFSRDMGFLDIPMYNLFELFLIIYTKNISVSLDYARDTRLAYIAKSVFTRGGLPRASPSLSEGESSGDGGS